MTDGEAASVPTRKKEGRAFAFAALSFACLLALASTYDAFADVWLTATPFALMGWVGFAAAMVGVVTGADRPRALSSVLAMIWVALWTLTMSADAQDLVAAVRRATFAFIAF
jgi:hypothetical protein